MKRPTKLINVAQEVVAAQADNNPVVALESTIISHGMPYPKNVETALEVEAAIRHEGAVPATMAIIHGVPKAGLSVDEIEQLGKAGQSVTKVSRRDFPVVISQKLHGATTVAGTMILAEKAGIRLFATGGIGGVHRDGQNTMDISADLQELAQTNVAVVSAGVKSILDLELTLEYLETMGVPVLGYQTDELPAFFSRSSGFKLDRQVDDVEQLAQMLHAKWDFGLQGGVLIGNPVPKEWSISKEKMDAIIELALEKAARLHIKGKAVTPFLLSEIESISKGQSLATNIQLVLNNAKLAAQVAVAYGQLDG